MSLIDDKIPGKEGWLYREVDLDARHALCGTDGSFLKVIFVFGHYFFLLKSFD